jgi:hypothetical protein
MRLLVVAVVLIATAACPAPGEGGKAQRGYSRAAPIIAALNRFHADSGQYPITLQALVPLFLPDSALAVPAREQERYPWTYKRVGDAYSLQFRYTGPGSNECTYFGATRQWQCSGLN